MNKTMAICLSLALCGAVACSAQPKIGKSMGRWKDFGPVSMEVNRAGGLRYVEVTVNDLWRTAKNHDEICRRADKVLADIRATGLEVWSVHLPFSRTLDISVLNDSARAANVAFMAEMIALAGRFRPRVLVLHPSSEPIAPEEREQRLRNSHASIGQLAPAARAIGATLCVENLPRTCLGQNAQEMMRLVEGYKGVKLCFDTNHLMYQSHADYLAGIGKGMIGNVHLSDYDFVNERHWIPGQGQIGWGALWQGIRANGYRGIMMFECYGEPGELSAAREMILRKAAEEGPKSK